MGLRPKTQRCLCPMKYGESRMLEGKRVPGGFRLWRFDQESLGCLPLVTMMQATDLREGNDLAHGWRMYRTGFRAILVE